MRLDAETSRRIGLLRFPLILGVIYIHNYQTVVNMAGGGALGAGNTAFYVDFIRNLISNGVARIAVPLFFMMSGYLFYCSFDGTLKSYGEKITRRIKSLLVPFLFWNIATLALFYVGQSLPATSGFFSRFLVTNLSFIEYINAIFGINRAPIAYQFWFIRDLMLLVLLSPLVYRVAKFAPIPTIAILLFCWMSKTWPIFAPSVDATLFFSVGAVLGLSGTSLFALDRYGRVFGVFYISCVLASTYWHDTVLGSLLLKISIVVGLVAALYLTKIVRAQSSTSNTLLFLDGASFFIFAAHEPLLTISRKVIYKLVHPHTSPEFLLLYLLIPIGLVLFLIGLYRFFKFVAPGPFRVICGGH